MSFWENVIIVVTYVFGITLAASLVAVAIWHALAWWDTRALRRVAREQERAARLQVAADEARKAADVERLRELLTRNEAR